MAKEKSFVQLQGKAHHDDTTKRNDYGFLNFKAKWHEDLGWKKGMLLKIDKNSDGSTTMKKA
jgi:hypothetical protein